MNAEHDHGAPGMSVLASSAAARVALAAALSALLWLGVFWAAGA